MTELVDQLVDEMKEIKIEPKYVVIKATNKRLEHMKKVFCGNDKEILKNRLLDHIIKKMLLGEYLDVDKIRDCDAIYFRKQKQCLELFRNGESEQIMVSPDTYKCRLYAMFLKKDMICLYPYPTGKEISPENRYLIIEKFKK